MHKNVNWSTTLELILRVMSIIGGFAPLALSYNYARESLAMWGVDFMVAGLMLFGIANKLKNKSPIPWYVGMGTMIGAWNGYLIYLLVQVR